MLQVTFRFGIIRLPNEYINKSMSIYTKMFMVLKPTGSCHCPRLKGTMIASPGPQSKDSFRLHLHGSCSVLIAAAAEGHDMQPSSPDYWRKNVEYIIGSSQNPGLQYGSYIFPHKNTGWNRNQKYCLPSKLWYRPEKPTQGFPIGLRTHLESDCCAGTTSW